MAPHENEPSEERLLRALQAPGTPEELGEHERYAAMFRDHYDEDADGAEVVPLARTRRSARRVAVGGGAAVVLAVATGGVAAAYQGSLPGPVQSVAHHVIGAPAPSPASAAPPPADRTTAPSRHSASPSPSASGHATSPSASATGHHHTTRHASATASASAGASATASATPTTPTGTPSGTATGTPTSSPTVPVATSVSIAAQGHRADVGQTVLFTGQVVATGGTPDPRQSVLLQARTGTHWRTVAHGRTDKHGVVRLTSPELEQSTSFRLTAGSLHTAAWRIAMRPTLRASAAVGRKSSLITVVATGGRPGDGVQLLVRSNGRYVSLSRTRLDAFGEASFTVTPAQQRTHYLVVLPGTRQHLRAQDPVLVVRKGAGRKGS